MPSGPIASAARSNADADAQPLRQRDRLKSPRCGRASFSISAPAAYSVSRDIRESVDIEKALDNIEATLRDIEARLEPRPGLPVLITASIVASAPALEQRFQVSDERVAEVGVGGQVGAEDFPDAEKGIRKFGRVAARCVRRRPERGPPRGSLTSISSPFSSMPVT